MTEPKDRTELRGKLLKLFTSYIDDEWHREGYPVKAELMADDTLALFAQEAEAIKVEARKLEFDVTLLQLVERFDYEISEGNIVQDNKVLGEANFEILCHLLEARMKAIRKEEREKNYNWFIELIENYGNVDIRKYEIRTIVRDALKSKEK